MDTSILLAKLIGPMLLVMGLFVAFNPAQSRRIGHEFLDSDALLFLSGVLTLPVGLAIGVTHKVWAADWRVVSTLFGWIAIFVIVDMGRSLGVAGFILVATGGLLHTIGAVVYALRRRNPWPHTFGYHEIFHLLGIGGAALHYVSVAFIALPNA